MRANGATTIWEMWEKDLPGHSLLHSSYLFAAPWYIDGIGGIKKDETKPGFQHFNITVPDIPENELNEATTRFNSPAGMIKTQWKRSNGRVWLAVTVPPNCTATVYMPLRANAGTKIYQVEAGQHEFTH